MQRVCFEGLTAVLLGSAHQCSRAGYIYYYGDSHNQEAPIRDRDRHIFEKEPSYGLVDDPDTGDQQKQGLDEGGEVLDLPVAIVMLTVRWPPGDPNRQECNDRRNEVKTAVGRLRKETQAVSQQPHHQLHAGKENGSQDRR